jgi:UDP-GlcNAc:undecaprenyl-phosphate/decaprenyl-phosphate GlcNAc-1-phosphate transferase
MIHTTYLIAFGLGLIASLLLTPAFSFISTRFGIMDKPESADRKKHKKAIPLLGGWAIFLSVFLSVFIFRYFDLADFSRISDKFLLAVFFGSLLLMIGGTLDDKYKLKPWQQIVWPLLAVLVVVLAGIKISYITNPIGGPSNAILYLLPTTGSIIAFIWLMGMMYTTKLLDGLDGLVGGVTAIASFMIFLLSLNWDIAMSATGVWAIALCGASLGFLVFNFHPAKIFLGEGGSLFVGFMLGVLSIISGSKIATTFLVVGIPALDVLWVIIRRVINGQSPFSHADRKHLHFQLLDIGFKHREAVLFLYLVAIIFGLTAVLSGSLGKLLSLIVLSVIMALIVSVIYLKSVSNVYKK